MLGTGLRIGEACAVRWAAVDLDVGVLEVNSTVIRSKEQGLIVQERPKTAAGWRVIALPISVADRLRRRQRRGAPAPAAVFRSPLGQLRDRSNTTGDLRRTFDRVGFDWVSSHACARPSRPAWTRSDSVPRQIADHLGHARPSLTQDVYMGRKVVSSEPRKRSTSTGTERVGAE
jgi:integrase